MEGGLMVRFEDVTTTWAKIAPAVSKPQSEDDLQRLIKFSHFIIDKLEENDDSGLEELLDIVGDRIHEYEAATLPGPQADAVDMIQMFMENHDLKQKDLTELGSTGVISEIMNRKRPLNIRHVKALATRFGCSPAVFID